MTLLDLSQEERDALSPDELARLEAEAELAFINAERLDYLQWNHLVERWNSELDPAQRKQAHATCVRTGHDWVGMPFKARVCRRCVSYVLEED